MNPVLEAQAIGRVHRLGQTRNVEVVRLLMKDSIETRINHLLEIKSSHAHFSSNDSKETGGSENENVASSSPVVDTSIVGSMRTEMIRTCGEEFDFLFGLTKSLDSLPYKYMLARRWTTEYRC